MRLYIYRHTRRKRIPISLLDRFVFTVTLGNEILSLFFKFKVGIRILIDSYIN